LQDRDLRTQSLVPPDAMELIVGGRRGRSLSLIQGGKDILGASGEQTARRRHMPAIGTRLLLRRKRPTNEFRVLELVSEVIERGRRFRVVDVDDQVTRSGLASEVDSSLTAARVARELDRVVATWVPPALIDSDYRAALTSNAMLRWANTNGVEWYTIAWESPRKMTLARASPWTSFGDQLSAECPNDRVFALLAEARWITAARKLRWKIMSRWRRCRRGGLRSNELWRLDDNATYPRSSLGYAAPDAFASSWHAANDWNDVPGAGLRPVTGWTAVPIRSPHSDPLLDGPQAESSHWTRDVTGRTSVRRSPRLLHRVRRPT
jgi:hypothetical protein